jgi:hypothetical protein
LAYLSDLTDLTSLLLWILWFQSLWNPSRFLNYSRNNPASGPLHLLFPSLGNSCLVYLHESHFALPLYLSYYLRGFSLTFLSKITTCLLPNISWFLYFSP